MTQFKEITMPSLGADMTEGMLVEWLVHIGEQVHNGQVIAVLETQKGAIDMEVYYDGTITELLVQPVKTVPVGTVLAKLELTEKKLPAKVGVEQQATDEIQPREKLPELEPEQKEAKLQDITKEQVAQGKLNIAHSQSNKAIQTRILASPVVKVIAIDNKLDLSTIIGSGPNGAVILKDIEQVPQYKSKQTSPEKSKQTSAKLTQMRSAISTAMVKSKQTIPHFYLSKSIEVNNAQLWLQQINQGKSPKERILLIALLLRAVALTLQKFPQLNGFYLNKQFESSTEINIANVISLRTGGVVVPAIRNVEQLTVPQIMAALQDVTSRARSMDTEARLRSSELIGATITVTNMGDRGADNVFGVIYPPQVAIIGFGKVKEVPQVRDENINVGEQLTVSLSADHRVIDGMLAGKFLNAFAKKIQKPERL